MISAWWLLIAFFLGTLLGTAVAGWFLFHQALRMLIRVLRMLEEGDEVIWGAARGSRAPSNRDPAKAEVAGGHGGG